MRTFNRLIAFLVLWFSMAAAWAGPTDDAVFSTSPVDNEGKRWRVAYFEGGEYTDYQKILTETVKGLMRLGWIETVDIPAQQGEQTAVLWQWLHNNVKSDYIEFVADGHYSSAWDEALRDSTAEKVIQRLNEQQDIDLMIAMGTWAGKALSNDRYRVPTMVLSASDPLAAGIIKSVDDSGYDHLHATVDPGRYDRQVRVFHDIINFKRLGVAYEDSENGRSYAALDVITKQSKNRGFDIVGCHTLSDISDTAKAEQSVVDCFNSLVAEVDAIYITNQGGVNSRSITRLVDIANQRGIPTFSQSGSEEVRYGVLLSLSQAGFRYVGDFHAATFAKVFNGALPNQLTQFFEEPPRMAVNLKTAEIVGFNPPLLLLGAADEIYKDIQNPQ